MANRYWVGGTANWDGTAGTKWSDTSGGAGGFSVPTSADDVFFSAASTGTCTISAGNTGAKSINCTGFTGTLTGSAGITVSGDITFVAGMTLSVTNTITIDGTATLITGGKALWNLTINGAGITVTLGDALTLGITLTVTTGTFTTNNYNVTAASLSSNNSNVRAINLGSSTLSFNGGTPISFFTSTNLTFNAGTSQINITNATNSVNGGGVTFYNLSYTSTTAGSRGLTGANTLTNLTLVASATGLSQLSFSDNQTINGTFTCSGSSAIARGFLRSNTVGTVRTLTVNTLSATDCDFRDITIAGAAAGSSPTRAGDCGGNSGITFPAAKTVYWNLAGAQNWNATAWAPGSGGTPDINQFPLAQDTAVFDDTGAAGTITANATYNIGALSASSRTSAMTLSVTALTNVYSSITLGSGLTISGTGSWNFLNRGTTDITTAGKTITFGIAINANTGTVRLLDSYTASNSITLTSGTFNANNYNVTCTNYISTGIVTRTTTMGSGLWTITSSGNAWYLTSVGNTLNINTADILFTDTSTNLKVFYGAGFSYNKLTIGGATGISTCQFDGSNTFTELASTKTVAHTLNFTSGTTTTVGVWSIAGTAGNVVTIKSVTAGSAHNLVKTGGGIVSSDYLSITDSAASPSSTWYAGASSTNVSNNSGWIFTAAPPSSGGNFLMFL